MADQDKGDNMSHDEWKLKELSIASLMLDPMNYRLGSVNRPTQLDIIEDLLEHEQVMDLIKDIVSSGFFPSEIPVVFKDGRNYVVAEGNRRVSSLKLLHNPDLAPAKYRKRIRKIRANMHFKAERIKVYIAPSKEATIPLIVSRHKGTSIRAWSTVMQSKFVSDQLGQGQTYEDVAQMLGVETSDVIKAKRNSDLIDIIGTLPLPEEVERVARSPRDFKLSTLGRLIDSTPIKTLLQLKSDQKSGWGSDLDGELFLSALSAIVTDVVLGVVTSRTHNTLKEHKIYAKELRERLSFPTKRKKSELRPLSDFVDPSKDPTETEIPPVKKKRKPRTPQSLIPKSFQVTAGACCVACC